MTITTEQLHKNMKRMRRCEEVRLAHAERIAESLRYEDSSQAAERKKRAEERAEIKRLLYQGVPIEKLKARYGSQAQEVDWANRDKAMMRVYDQYEKTERDWISNMKGAERKGEQIGIAKGEQIGIAKGIVQGRTEGEQIGIAKMMALLEQGVSVEEIKARYGV